MTKKLLTLVTSTLTATLLLSGCGGSSPSDNPTTSETSQANILEEDAPQANNLEENAPVFGKIIYKDSAIGGISYVCGKKEGKTDASGEIIYEIGKGCTLYVGKTPLREVLAEELIDKKILWETNQATIVVLQALDNDGDPSTGINIDPETIDILEQLSLPNIPSTPEELEAVKEKLAEAGFVIPSDDDAFEHLMISRLGNQTLYFQDGKGGIASILFGNLLESILVDIGGVTSENIVLDIVEGKLFLTDRNYLEILDINEDSILVRKGTIGEIDTAEVDVLYFKKKDVPLLVPSPIEDTVTIKEEDLFGEWTSECITVGSLAPQSMQVKIVFGKDGTYSEETSNHKGTSCKGDEYFAHYIRTYSFEILPSINGSIQGNDGKPAVGFNETLIAEEILKDSGAGGATIGVTYYTMLRQNDKQEIEFARYDGKNTGYTPETRKNNFIDTFTSGRMTKDGTLSRAK